MRIVLLILVTVIVSGCAGLQGVDSGGATQTPLVIVQTVLVTAQDEQPTPPAPTSTTAPTATLEIASPTSSAGFAAPPATAGGMITIPASFYGQAFSNVAVSTNAFSLRCAPKEIAFDVTTADIYITQVDLYIRVRDKHSLDVPNWSWSRTMETDGVSHFWVTLRGEDVPADLRKAQGWFDFQVVGLGKTGAVIGRSEKITDQVSYTIDC